MATRSLRAVLTRDSRVDTSEVMLELSLVLKVDEELAAEIAVLRSLSRVSTSLRRGSAVRSHPFQPVTSDSRVLRSLATVSKSERTERFAMGLAETRLLQARKRTVTVLANIVKDNLNKQILSERLDSVWNVCTEIQ